MNMSVVNSVVQSEPLEELFIILKRQKCTKYFILYEAWFTVPTQRTVLDGLLSDQPTGHVLISPVNHVAKKKPKRHLWLVGFCELLADLAILSAEPWSLGRPASPDNKPFPIFNNFALLNGTRFPGRSPPFFIVSIFQSSLLIYFYDFYLFGLKILIR